MRDRDRAGRTRKLDRHPLAKLTLSQASEIKRRCRAGERTVDVALSFGVSREVVSKIARGVTWKEAA